MQDEKGAGRRRRARLNKGDAVFGEANALGGGDIEGPGAGPDAQSAGPADTGEGIIGHTSERPVTASDIGGGDDLGEAAD